MEEKKNIISDFSKEASTVQLTFQTLFTNHSIGSLCHCQLQGFTAHLIQPARAQSSLLLVGAKGLNQ